MKNQPFIICLIDDDDIYQFTATRRIEQEKIAKKILVFSEAENALQFLVDNIADNENLPDIIFLDLNMPVMDGWEFLEEYTRLKPRLAKRITLYVVSSSVSKADIDRAKKIEEVSDYLIKPVSKNMLLTVINDVLKIQSYSESQPIAGEK